jgi:hypothetical protein
MKAMIKVLLVLVALEGAVFALGGTANAADVKVEIVAPTEAVVGRPVDIQATLHLAGDGSALAGVPVTLYTKASFGDVTGDVELAKAMTDANGLAVLSYEPRSAGDHQIRVEYLAPGASAPAVATASISVAGSTQQLYRSTAGVKIPGLNVWLLMAVLAGVWAILLSVALRVIAIAHAGADVEALLPRGASRQMGGDDASQLDTTQRG